MTVALALPQVRSKLVGTSNLRNALIPLVTAALLWATVTTADFLKGRIEEDTVPADILTLNIQRVDFGVPQISYVYRDHDYSEEEVKRFLAPLTTIDEDVHLTDDERSRLNDISQPSGMIDELPAGRSISTGDLARVLYQTVAYYYDYKEWSRVSLSLADLIDTGRKGTDRTAIMSSLIAAMVPTLDTAGMFQGIIGMAWRRTISLESVPGDCNSSSSGTVTSEQEQAGFYLVFPTFRARIAPLGDPPGRKRLAQQFAEKFESGCLETLAGVFRSASSTFSAETRIMDKYVAELNQILAAKKPESIRISVAISNTGLDLTLSSAILRKLQLVLKVELTS
jgi:hypothetical protein